MAARVTIEATGPSQPCLRRDPDFIRGERGFVLAFTRYRYRAVPHK